MSDAFILYVLSGARYMTGSCEGLVSPNRGIIGCHISSRAGLARCLVSAFRSSVWLEKGTACMDARVLMSRRPGDTCVLYGCVPWACAVHTFPPIDMRSAAPPCAHQGSRPRKDSEVPAASPSGRSSRSGVRGSGYEDSTSESGSPYSSGSDSWSSHASSYYSHTSGSSYTYSGSYVGHGARVNAHARTSPAVHTHEGRTHDGRTHDGRAHDGRTHDGRTHDGRTHDGRTEGRRDGRRKKARASRSLPPSPAPSVPPPDAPPPTCQLCAADFDDLDMEFDPCACGVRICLTCFDKVMSAGNGRCPGCGALYGVTHPQEARGTGILAGGAGEGQGCGVSGGGGARRGEGVDAAAVPVCCYRLVDVCSTGVDGEPRYLLQSLFSPSPPSAVTPQSSEVPKSKSVHHHQHSRHHQHSHQHERSRSLHSEEHGRGVQGTHSMGIEQMTVWRAALPENGPFLLPPGKGWSKSDAGTGSIDPYAVTRGSGVPRTLPAGCVDVVRWVEEFHQRHEEEQRRVMVGIPADIPFALDITFAVASMAKIHRSGLVRSIQRLSRAPVIFMERMPASINKGSQPERKGRVAQLFMKEPKVVQLLISFNGFQDRAILQCLELVQTTKAVLPPVSCTVLDSALTSFTAHRTASLTARVRHWTLTGTGDTSDSDY
eukprot:jgi/Mesvir1/11779/Mv00146-RA.1